MHWSVGPSRYLGIVILAFLLAFAAAPASAADNPQQSYVLRILHTNDHHAHLEPVKIGDKDFGGIAKRKAAVDMIRAGKDNVLLLDAGDVFQGTLYFNQYLGQADLYFYNQLKYDAMTVGNHEFDKGQKPLADFIAGATFPVLSANIVADASSPLAGKIKPWVIKDVAGQKVGIFGLTTEETPILSSPGQGVTFTPAVDAARKSVADLTAQGVNKIVALSHLGFFADEVLAKQVAGIDVIVGGHTHTPLGNEPDAVAPYPVIEKGPTGDQVVIVQDWEWGKYLGDISVGFDAQGRVTGWMGMPIPVDDKLQPDPGFQSKLKEFAAKLDDLRNTKVGQSAVKLEGDRNIVRAQETNLGDLIADSLVDKTKKDGTVIAIMNGGGVRTSIPAGDVTMGQVIEVMPFGNTIVTMDLTGALIKEALENGVSQVETGAGRFPQVSGLRFTWNPDAPAGARVGGVEVKTGDGYKAIDPAATYKIATNDFMAAGGDGYTAFMKGTNAYNTNFVMSDVLAEYIQAKSPVNLQPDGRIVQGVAMAMPSKLPNTGEAGVDPATAGLVVLLIVIGAAGVTAGRRVRKSA